MTKGRCHTLNDKDHGIIMEKSWNFISYFLSVGNPDLGTEDQHIVNLLVSGLELKRFEI